MQFSELQKLRDLDLDFDLGSGRGHTGAHIWSTYTNTANYIEIGKTFSGRTGGRTDGRTLLPIVGLLGHLRSSPMR